jgi:hypothetical protein
MATGHFLAATVATVALGAISSQCAAQVAGLPALGVSAPQIAAGVDERQVSLDVTGAYDSNVARSTAALAAERGIIQQDFYVVPSANALFSQVFGRETVYLDATAGYKAYAKNPILDRSTIAIGAGAVGQLSLCQGTVASAYDRSQADLSTLPVGVEGGRPVAAAKDTQTNAVVDFTAICGRSIGFAPTGNVSEAWVTNDNTAFSAINAHIFSGSGGITYRSPVLGSATVSGQYSKVEYPDRILPFGGGTVGVGFQTTGAGVTFARAVGSRLSGTASINYTHLEPQNGFTQGFSGVTYNADLSYALNPRLTLTGVVGRGVTPSNEIEASFMVAEIYGAQASYALGSRLTVSTGYSRTHDNYEGIVIPVTFNLTEQTINSFYGNATFQLNKRISIGPSINYSQRTANFAPFNYKDVLAAATVKSTF